MSPQLPPTQVESRGALKRKEPPGDENAQPQFRKRNRQMGHSHCTGSLPTASTSGFVPEASSSTPTAPSTSTVRRCRYDNCAAVLHFPTEAHSHLETAHGLRDTRNAVPGRPNQHCQWENCPNNGGRGVTNSLLRHVEGHMVCLKCNDTQCPPKTQFSRPDSLYRHCLDVHNIQKDTIKVRLLEHLHWLD